MKIARRTLQQLSLGLVVAGSFQACTQDNTERPADQPVNTTMQPGDSGTAVTRKTASGSGKLKAPEMVRCHTGAYSNPHFSADYCPTCGMG